MLRMKRGELQIQYDGMSGRIYVRILKQKDRVDVVATSAHIQTATSVLGHTNEKDSKDFPLWRDVSACNLASLIEDVFGAESNDENSEQQLLKEVTQQAIKNATKKNKEKTMDDADVELNRVLDNLPAESRPFVSYGNPLKSDVLIVGLNPATGGDICWRDYWEPPVFHGNQWRNEVYLALRNQSPSPTWRNMKQLEDAASNLSFTETNVYSMHSPDATSLDNRDTSAFDALLEHASPKLIIPHGKEAVEYLENALNITLKWPAREKLIGEYTHASGYDVLPIWHLSRLWSYDRLDSLGAELNNHYG